MDFNDLLQRAITVKNNVNTGSNTAPLVGGVLVDIVNSLMSDPSMNVPDGISLSLDQTTFEITASLKVGNTVIATSQAIDLPLETVVVSGEYDNANKAIILTLKNGTEIDIPVDDLVSGLVSEDELATVATTGDYNDLNNKPTIPNAQIQSDWDQTNSALKDYIKNKPTIPTVPTNVSAFNNDANYLASQANATSFSGVMESGKNYILSASVSSLTITSFVTGYLESNLVFTVGSASFSLSLPSGTRVAGSVPQWENGASYIMSMWNGIVVFAKLNAYA